jgi:hypothetical protein
MSDENKSAAFYDFVRKNWLEEQVMVNYPIPIQGPDGKPGFLSTQGMLVAIFDDGTVVIRDTEGVQLAIAKERYQSLAVAGRIATLQ